MFFSVYVCLFFFFFFQAEDGIRDLTVTGVQTCALPIYPMDFTDARWPARTRGMPPATGQIRIVRSMPADAIQAPSGLIAMSLIPDWLRSEERRVGKECRSRWWT